MEAGKECMKFEAGAFSYYGVMAISPPPVSGKRPPWRGQSPLPVLEPLLGSGDAGGGSEPRWLPPGSAGAGAAPRGAAPCACLAAGPRGRAQAGARTPVLGWHRAGGSAPFSPHFGAPSCPLLSSASSQTWTSQPVPGSAWCRGVTSASPAPSCPLPSPPAARGSAALPLCPPVSLDVVLCVRRAVRVPARPHKARVTLSQADR